KSRRKELPVPVGRKPSSMRSGGVLSRKPPLITSCAVPSPPTARNRRYPCWYASLASCATWPALVEAITSTASPFALRRERTSPASFDARPPPAAGFTIAKNVSFTVSSERAFYLFLG